MVIDIDDELALALRLAEKYAELTRRLAAGARVNHAKLEQVTRDARLVLAEAETCGIVRVVPTEHGTLVIEMLDRKLH